MAWGRRRDEPAEQQGWDDPMWVPQPVEQWVTPEVVAERLRRRRGRWRALRHGVVLLLVITVVGGTGVIAAGAVLGRWALPFAPEPQAAPSVAPTGAPCEPAAVQPANVQGTSVTVLNGTDRTGLAGGTADELEARGFTIAEIGNAPREVEAAVVRYSPVAEPAALVVAANLQGAVLEPDERVDVVTVVLGETWAGLAAPDVAAEAAATPQPSRVRCADGSQGVPVLPGASPAPGDGAVSPAPSPAPSG
ncbi:LytR C-terminal domain-containing protein [Aquipuribacter nitratireducens]|uniref:LytR C-terminal domain-containing protein n=1 Tax=Aquipuribacter nitratireducens TaxID=650104 RepID=A0ABW0GRT8_9MICO